MAAAIRKIEMTASKKGQTIVSSFDPEDGTLVPLDKDMFEQVMLNVLSNSIKYTGEGGRIEVGGGIDGGNYVIRVSDNGIGIPAESIPRIFDRFYRVDKARSRAMGSTGLGLAITKQIVEEHGGSIRAESVEGEGTTMFISFPLYNEEAEAPGETGGAEA
ncbi:MAG: cell wall metabolism sensor histidine kinase WalK, partial [Firmicutes bacterium]|nr:cell wall metabolism sensor histidine kinase WalK [Bacillota bacterium]